MNDYQKMLRALDERRSEIRARNTSGETPPDHLYLNAIAESLNLIATMMAMEGGGNQIYTVTDVSASLLIGEAKTLAEAYEIALEYSIKNCTLSLQIRRIHPADQPFPRSKSRRPKNIRSPKVDAHSPTSRATRWTNGLGYIL